MLDDGTVFDVSSKHDKPLKFEVGGGRLIPGFDKAVNGMNLGQDRKREVGMRLVIGTPEGQQIQALITEVTPEYILF